ncbi:restriction endonuclease subunit S [Xylella fastidiosa]|uniref:restriction endonuclease subunit S n=1 Tax=Xylella fastidiosa TaxID=2371 RepID=UPI0007084302|nr:restriction endonuclease subunit S [Xylella fastidiosa]KQH74728.1 restriction endonuclease subunit S [Xylella fastidiosa]WNY19061.1 restriction endonuclease subunit S [Xylella fastidiosa]WNY21350.1 restriction endonuclease subunit S [Xylella fastidiosa]
MFGPYPDYRRTNLKWFEYLPESWAILRTKQMFRLVIEKAPANNQMELLSVYTHIGVRPRKSLEQRGNKASTTDGYWVVKEGDIICNKLLAWMGAIGASHYQGVTSPAYDILTPIKSCNTDYYHFLFRTKKYLQQFKIRSRGIMDMRLRLYFDQFGQIPIPVPPRPEQDQIVAYLRAQDAHIARFIKAKRDLIKLLTEQKLRIIDHAVTRGLDASVALKPSGIEWLGDVPVNWEVMSLKRACVRSALYGANIPATHYTDIGVRFLRTTDILESSRLKHGGVFLPGKMVSDYLLADGDILLSRSGTIGRSFLFRADQHGQCSYAGYLVRFSPAKFLFPDFLFFYTKTRAFADFIKLNAISTTIENLNGDKYAKMAVPVPPLDEQRNICRWIADECQPLDDAITRTEDEIKLIREYRDRLITDVVTGQVDVRGWQPGPEDVVEDAVLAALGDDQEEMTEQEDDDDED